LKKTLTFRYGSRGCSFPPHPSPPRATCHVPQLGVVTPAQQVASSRPCFSLSHNLPRPSPKCGSGSLQPSSSAHSVLPGLSILVLSSFPNSRPGSSTLLLPFWVLSRPASPSTPTISQTRPPGRPMSEKAMTLCAVWKPPTKVLGSSCKIPGTHLMLLASTLVICRVSSSACESLQPSLKYYYR
jgi:hypothetical protein